MDTLYAIFGLMVAVAVLINMFSGDPHEQAAKYRAEADKLQGEHDQAVADATQKLKDVATSNLEADHDTRTLSLFSLVSLSALTFGDMLDSTKKADPLIPLCIIYCWLEQLSEDYDWPAWDVEEYPEKTSSLTKFIWTFVKSELTDDEWANNFFMLEDKDDVESNVWFDEISGFRFIRDRIKDSFEDSSLEEKSNMCAIFSSELIEYIDDDELKERFVVLARESLNDAGLMTGSAESTLASMDL
jgi:hypothetical protein|tara:strand:- start:625 stop:1356 length:732 start_codon:yes stop_codon:yes gene_type:complete